MPARGGPEVALGIYYKTFLIYRTCMRRAPARPVRACVLCGKLLRRCCPRTWPPRNPGARQRQAKTFRTLHTALFALHTPHFTLALRTPHFSHLKACELFSPHLSSSHLIPSLLTCHQNKFNCFHLILALINLSHLLEVVLNSSQLFCTPEKLLLSERCLLHKKDFGSRKFLYRDTWDTNAFRQKSLSDILCTTKLAQSTSQHYFVLQSLHKARPDTTTCNTKLAQSTSQYFCVLQSLHNALSISFFLLQSLHKVLPSTTLYYKACTNYFPVLLSTTKLAKSTSQHYFVVQSLHKVFPSTTLYYKACTNYFPLLLCTTKLAQTTSQQYFVLQKACAQYYFVLQSLQKVLPSTTLYHEACAKHFLPSTTLYYKASTTYVPVLLCDTKLAQRKLWHTASSFAEKLLHTASFDTEQAFTHRTLKHSAFTHGKHLHGHTHTARFLNREAFTHTQKLVHTTSFYTEKILHREAFTHSKLVHIQQAFTHRTLTHSAFRHGKRLHRHSKLFKQRRFYTQQAFTQRSFYTEQAFTHSKRLHTEHLHTVLLHMANVYTHTEQAF